MNWASECDVIWYFTFKVNSVWIELWFVDYSFGSCSLVEAVLCFGSSSSMKSWPVHLTSNSQIMRTELNAYIGCLFKSFSSLSRCFIAWLGFAVSSIQTLSKSNTQASSKAFSTLLLSLIRGISTINHW